ncbi:MAG: TrmH family RNA methyltransferase, partial [Actinomycetota bacterium]
PDIMAACTHRVRIEMGDGVDSLNVAAASAIACYTLRK